jgi:hypothetical protein
MVFHVCTRFCAYVHIHVLQVRNMILSVYACMCIHTICAQSVIFVLITLQNQIAPYQMTNCAHTFCNQVVTVILELSAQFQVCMCLCEFLYRRRGIIFFITLYNKVCHVWWHYHVYTLFRKINGFVCPNDKHGFECVCVCVCVCILHAHNNPAETLVCVCVCVCVCVYIYIYICTHLLCSCVCAYIYIYTYTRKSWRKTDLFLISK